MPPESNGPDVKMPDTGALKDFLDGADTEPVVEDVEDEGTGLRADEPDDLPAGDTFDRKYVEKLRRENASYRERAKKYESAFEGYEDGAIDEWKTLITNFKADPASTARQMAELAESVLTQFGMLDEDEKQEVLDEANANLDPAEKPLTRRELEQFYSERQQEQQMESMVKGIEDEARDLGYNLNSREYKILLMTAQEIPSGDLKEAHQLILADRQRAVDEYVAEKSKGAGRTLPNNGIVGVPDGAKDIKTFADSKAALMNFLDANK